MTVNHIDFGGGCGVRYVNALEHEAIPREENSDPELPAATYLDAFLPILKETGCQIWIEPGRLLVADSCVLITRVLYTKETGNKKFIIVDAGMTELIRPALYDSYHQIVPLTIETYECEIVDIVGPVCESSDFFAKDRLFPKINPGQHVAILTTGAYGYVQSINYNSRPRPAEIMVNGERVRTIREREPRDWY
jgi:diaminopimelate decarboxylase